MAAAETIGGPGSSHLETRPQEEQSMNGRVNWWMLCFGGVLAIGAVALLLASLFADEIFPEYSPAHRGRQVAAAGGCFSCHGGLGHPASVNPGRDVAGVPDLFHERQSLEELRQWIEDGISESKRQSQSFLSARENRILHMPAYRDQLNRTEIEDLVAFVALHQYSHSVRNRNAPSPGEELARRFACFTCHGELGQGGVENPGSLKGYIPGFFGTDFRALTRNGDRQDLREWILDGHSQFFWEQGFAGFHPGQYFTARQAIRMPGYRGWIADGEVETLVDYLRELMELGPLSGEKLLKYRPLASPPEGKETPATVTPEESASPMPPALAILDEYCIRCHGPEKQRSSYRLDSREAALRGGEIAGFKGVAAISAGDPESGLLMRFVQAHAEDPLEEIYPMPPLDQPRLSPPQIEVLRDWILQGAPF